MRRGRRTLSVVLMLMAFVVTIGIAKAQDERPQPPIIALFDNKLYAVSALDGTARVLAEPPAGQRFVMDDYASVSPDGKQMVYATSSDPDISSRFNLTLFILDLEAGQSTLFQPGGGVFDTKPRDGYHFRVDYPTWSVDGSRLYYVRSAVDQSPNGKTDEVQLGYWDVKTLRHKLVARLNPKRHVFNLMAVKSGIIAHSFTEFSDPDFVALYAPDNHVVYQTDIVNIYFDPVAYKGQMYYATGNNEYGGIDLLTNVETGNTPALDAGYYPAVRSRSAGDRSMNIFRYTGSSGTWYSVYGPDYEHYLGQIDQMYGVRYAFAPDGQSMAFLRFDDDSMKAPIRMMSADGQVRELPFEAQEIYWGVSEWAAFYAPG